MPFIPTRITCEACGGLTPEAHRWFSWAPACTCPRGGSPAGGKAPTSAQSAQSFGHLPQWIPPTRHGLFTAGA